MQEHSEGLTLPEPLAVPMAATQRDALLIDMHGRLAGLEVKSEAIPSLDARVRSLEKRQWGLPATLITAALAFLGIHNV